MHVCTYTSFSMHVHTILICTKEKAQRDTSPHGAALRCHVRSAGCHYLLCSYYYRGTSYLVYIAPTGTCRLPWGSWDGCLVGLTGAAPQRHLCHTHTGCVILVAHFINQQCTPLSSRDSRQSSSGVGFIPPCVGGVGLNNHQFPYVSPTNS